MRVLHISTEKNWRGGENQLRLLVQGLKEHGIENHLVVQPESSAAKIFAEVATTHPLKMRNDLDLFAAKRIASLCQREGIDLIHAHTARAHSLGLLAKKWLKCFGKNPPKLIVHRRVEQSKNLSWLERGKYLNPDVDLYICVSKAIAAGMVKAGVNSRRLRTVYSAVNPAPHVNRDAMRVDTRHEFQIPDEDFVVCCVAAMEEAKGVNYLLEAWQQVHRQDPRAKLLMIGEGNLKSALEEKAKSQSFGSSVIFTGFRRDVARLMAGADVLVLPTLWEGLGTVLLEGLLADCVIVGSDVGGVPEIIEDHKTGLLVPPGEPNAIAAALLNIKHHPAKSKQMIEAGQQHAAKHFSLQSMVEGNHQAYLDVLCVK